MKGLIATPFWEVSICFSKRVQLFFEALFSQFEFEESFVHEFELSFDFRQKKPDICILVS